MSFSPTHRLQYKTAQGKQSWLEAQQLSHHGRWEMCMSQTAPREVARLEAVLSCNAQQYHHLWEVRTMDFSNAASLSMRP